MSDVNNEVVQTATSDTTVEVTTVSLVDLLPEDMKANPRLTKFKDVTSLAKSYDHLESKLGSAITIPSAEASEDEMRIFMDKISKVPGVMKEPTAETDVDAIFTKLGRPMNPEGYRYELPSEDAITADQLHDINQEAFAMGLTQKQAQTFMNKKIAQMEATNKAISDKITGSEAYLKGVWGSAYEERMAAAKSAVAIIQNNHPEAAEELMNSTLANNPAVISMLAEIGHTVKEKSIGGTLKDSQYHMTPEYAQSQLNSLLKDKEFMRKFMSKNDIEHGKAVETYTKLSSQAAKTN